jgi:NarL family two-component system sensor histidine kinase LiaS
MLQFNDEGTDGLILGAEEALHLLRICQEAIHNAVKHARMNKLEISWFSAHGHYEIRIKDDGQGFNHLDNLSGHYGLENMKQRALEIRAAFSIETSPDQGSLIILSK